MEGSKEIRCGFARRRRGGGGSVAEQHGELDTGSLVLLLLVEGREREGLVL